jgi:hypothetical protein
MLMGAKHNPSLPRKSLSGNCRSGTARRAGPGSYEHALCQWVRRPVFMVSGLAGWRPRPGMTSFLNFLIPARKAGITEGRDRSAGAGPPLSHRCRRGADTCRWVLGAFSVRYSENLTAILPTSSSRMNLAAWILQGPDAAYPKRRNEVHPTACAR